MLTQNLPEYWEDKYQQKQDGWDQGKVTPCLADLLKHELWPKTGRVLVPGAGRGYDAAAIAAKGYDVVAVDYAQTAIEALRAHSAKQKKLMVLGIDLFELVPKSTESFDMIFDYGCFCAIHPGRRDEYFEMWDRMLKPDGIIAALFYPLLKGTSLEGPPHPTSEGELIARLDGVFDIVERIVPKKSFPGREGKEELWLLKKPS